MPVGDGTWRDDGKCRQQGSIAVMDGVVVVAKHLEGFMKHAWSWGGSLIISAGHGYIRSKGNLIGHVHGQLVE